MLSHHLVFNSGAIIIIVIGVFFFPDFFTGAGGGGTFFPCFAPTPIQFMLHVDDMDNNMVTLSWELDAVGTPDRENCTNIEYSVIARSFATYHDKTLPKYTQGMIEEGIQSFSTTELLSDRYHVFDVVTMYIDSSQMRRDSIVSSPVYYFGVQGKDECSYPYPGTVTLKIQSYFINLMS